MTMDDPLDFETEDLLLVGTSRLPSKRKNAIGLDDLLNDFHTEKNKSTNTSNSKQSKAKKGYESDEDDKKIRQNEITFCKFVNECQKQVNDIGTEDEIPLWGVKVFGIQKLPELLDHKMIEKCELLQSFLKSGVPSLFSIATEQGEWKSILEGLLINGWILQLAFKFGSIEDTIASWSFHKMLYSSNEDLQFAACEFWCSILLSKDEANKPLVKLSWYPNYSILKSALDSYGYIYESDDPSDNYSSEQISTDPTCEGPPLNVISWMKAVSSCCQIKNVCPIFSTFEAEELLGAIIWLFLDRQIQGLNLILSECLKSIVHYFSETEWTDSCTKVAKSIAQRVPKDLNCLRIVECITGSDKRSKSLRSQLALHIFMICFDTKVSTAKEAVKLLKSVNVKQKDCDFFKLYIYLALIENVLLLSYQTSEEQSGSTVDLWCKYLRNCSRQITSTDWRSYASKVRNKACYLLQSLILKKE